MPTALAVLVLAATLSAPQPTVQTLRAGAKPPLIVRTRDGQKIEVPVPSAQPKTRNYIVEFNDPPLLARKARGPVANAAASYKDNFTRFRNDLASTRAGKAAAAVEIGHEYYRTFHGVSVVLDENTAATVRRLSYVKAIHEDTTVKAFQSEDRERLERIGANRLRAERSVRGAGIVVAVVDTGVDYTHPALGGGLGPAYKVIGGIDFVDGDGDPMDEHGHGTHVAGIIAGTTADVPGVAPDARILAYRVLNEWGEGRTSNIIGAVERLVDPDLDGNTDDRADVANLSLGGYGDADSPLSLAVDRAVEAGVVFALAAGNDPGEQTIGAPAAARLGITVGASDSRDLVTYWSSRGPAAPAWDPKPEVVAPGDLIRSAKLGGGTVIASGTSMAAPHVAGAAALLLELHPEWTPADVKAALVGSADPVVADVMAQGGGRIDVYDAAGGTGSIAPAVVTFGRHGGAGAWSATRTVRITNRSNAPETFTASFASPGDVTVEAEPATFALDAGASREVVLRAAIGADAEAALTTLSHGGRVTFASDDVTVQVPWVAVDAAHVVLTHQLVSSPVWDCERGPVMTPRLSHYRHELLLPNSRCQVVALSLPDEGGGASLITKDVRIDGDVTVDFTIADAPHEVRLAGVNEKGSPIGAGRVDFSSTEPYSVQYDLVFPPSSRFGGISMGIPTSEALHVSDFSDDYTLIVSEMLFDFPRRAIYSIHHQPVHGVRGSLTLSTLPGDLRHARVDVRPQRAGTLLSGMMVYMAGGSGIGIPMGHVLPLEQGWSGDLYVTPDAAPDTWGGVALQTARPGDQVWSDISTPAFRAIGDRIVVSYDLTPSPAAYSVPVGGTIAVGAPLTWMGSFVDTRETAFAVFPSFLGPVDEDRVDPFYGLHHEIRDDSGMLLLEGTRDGYVSADFGRRGAFRVAYRATNGSELAVRFDTSQEDSNPPSVSSMRVVGADVGVVSRVDVGAPATLAFSVVDITRGENDVPRDSQRLRAARVFWRNGNGAWQPLVIAPVLEDRGDPLELGHIETGVHYRGDLSAATAAAGPIDLRVELEDAGGNTSASVVKDALVVGAARRRAVR